MRIETKLVSQPFTQRQWTVSKNHTTGVYDTIPVRSGTLDGNGFTTIQDSRSDITKTQKVKGWRPPTPYTFSEVWTGCLSGRYDCFGMGLDKSQGNGKSRVGAMPYFLSPLAAPSIPSGLVNQTIAQARARVKNQKVNLGMALASRKETAELLATASTRLVNAWNAARRLDWNDCKKLLKIPSNWPMKYSRSASKGWLELVFGWRPLVNDIWGLYQQFAKDERPALIRVKAVGKESEVKPVQRVFREDIFTASNWTCKASWYVEDTIDVQFTVVWYFGIANDKLKQLSEVGLLNPASIVWDRVPFSFVMDWLLPVGQFLNNLDAFAGVEFISGTETRFSRVTASIVKTVPSFTTGTPSVYSGIVDADFSGNAYRVNWNRLVVVEPPRAKLYIRNPFSTFTIVTAAALIVTNHSRMRRRG